MLTRPILVIVAVAICLVALPPSEVGAAERGDASASTRPEDIKQCGRGEIANDYAAQLACQRSFSAASILAALRFGAIELPQYRSWAQIAAHDLAVAEMARHGATSGFPPEPPCATETDIGDYDRLAVLRACPGARWTLANRGVVRCEWLTEPKGQAVDELKCGPDAVYKPQRMVEFGKDGPATEQVLPQTIPCQQVIEFGPGGKSKRTIQR